MSRKNRTPLQHAVLYGLLLSVAAALGGCNTVAGAGEDVRAGGRAIERSAQ